MARFRSYICLNVGVVYLSIFSSEQTQISATAHSCLILNITWLFLTRYLIWPINVIVIVIIKCKVMQTFVRDENDMN